MKNIYLTVYLLIAMGTAMAQSVFSIKGKVHTEGGAPLSHVTIKVEGTNLIAITDANGRYTFSSVPQGKYILLVSSVEIKTKKLTVDVNKNYADLHIHIDPKGDMTLDEVRIERKSAKKELETSGFAVSVIETGKVALQSIQTNELLDRSAGVRIRQDGGLGSHIHYNINGLSGNAVLIFIDGVPSTNYGSSFSLNSIPPALIERIEVYKGVLPSNLSQDALGGAINVILKKSRNRNSLITSYSLGSFNTHQWNAVGSVRKDNGLSFEGSAFYNYSDNNYRVWGEKISFKDYTGATELNQRAKRFNDAYQSYGGRVQVGFNDKKWADRFYVGGLISDEYKEIQHGRTMDKPYGDRHTRGTSKVINLVYNKFDFLLPGLSLKVDASYSYLTRQVIDTVGYMYDWRGKPIEKPDGSYVTYNSGAESGNAKTLAINSDKTFVTRANLGYVINSNNVLNINYFFNNFKRGTKDELQPLGAQLLENTRDLQKNILSFSYEKNSFGGKLKSNVFYKHYFQKITSNEPYLITSNPINYGLNSINKNINHSGYGVALSYALMSKLYLLGSAEKALRLPNANEMFGNVADNLLAPRKELNPEKSLNVNFGVNLGPFIWNKHLIRMNSSVFSRDIKGMIREGMQSGSNESTSFENLEDVISKGIDVEINYLYNNKFEVSFNVSKNKTLFNTEFNENGAPYLFYRTQIRNEPSFKFNANLSYSFDNLMAVKSITSVYYNINYVEQFLRNWANVGGNNLDIIPTQYANDAGFAYTFPSRKLTLSFDAKNIFNQQIFDNFGLQKPGRSFFGKVTYSIL